MPERTKPLATLKELKAESGLDVTTLYRKCAPYGDLPCIRLLDGSTATRRTRSGSKILVKWTDWDAWIERHRVGPPATRPGAAGRAPSSVLDLPGASRYSSRRVTTKSA